MCGLWKVHKDIINNCLPFRPIFSAINTPTYKLAKVLVPILKFLTRNEYTVKSSFAFVQEIFEQDSELFMGNLELHSLFRNIPLEETIVTCANAEMAESLLKKEFQKFLSLATKESFKEFFTFNGKLYKQVDGVTMGSPLGPILASVFLVYFEKN